MAVQLIQVLYDGVCKTCVADRQLYEKLIGTNGKHVVWCDYNQHQQLLEQFNISEQEAMAELHLIVDHKLVVKSIEAYQVLFHQIWYLKPISWLLSIRWLRERLRNSYDVRVYRRLKKTGRLD